MKSTTKLPTKNKFKRLKSIKRIKPSSSSVSKKRVVIQSEINAILKTVDNGGKVALIIINEDYSSSHYPDLHGIASDGELMEKMLQSYDEVQLTRSTSDIDDVVKKFIEQMNSPVKCLHLHYSGHGVDNATVELDSEICGTAKETMNEIALVECNGNLYSVHDLKHELLKCGPESLTLTLDCCRNNRSYFDREYARLRHRYGTDTDHLGKIAVIQGTSDLHPASDTNTFTQELYKVFIQENREIPILEIVSKVNKSWEDRNINQSCRHDIVEIGSNWKYYMWPTSSIFKPSNEDRAGIIETNDMAKTVEDLAERMAVLKSEKLADKNTIEENKERVQQRTKMSSVKETNQTDDTSKKIEDLVKRMKILESRNQEDKKTIEDSNEKLQKLETDWIENPTETRKRKKARKTVNINV